ncbi:MAG TPA: TolC family protein [Cyclobacteriaceae bacterium]|nr:TolC family protein [Cyclobacteriaceae bacterium]HMV08513.1 TolC family protein [Cyclobacteriaceae bacterium]HMV90001.1 TolC family protein [Cyclobacteriaceae bacterium]HMX01286.1 TolC family protein [Cyclobacteriaceae bacterium]HMX51300.1 TolC family protein [Cyclobacteriaceae bacterium]
MYRIIFICLACLTLTTQSFSQRSHGIDTLLTPYDSATRFGLNDLFAVVTANHPVARQASLLSESARQELRLARGSFDPKVQMQYLVKQNEGVEYYRIVNGGVKIPTRIAIDPSIGVEQNRGAYLNPERYIGAPTDYTQFYAGVSMPVGRGLFIDERRAMLNQAALMKGLNEAEQVKIVNKLLLEAAKEYWNWFYATANYQLIRKNRQIAQDIMSRIKTSYTYGEVSLVDTVQASITVQQRTVDLLEAKVNLDNARLAVSTYLWDSAGYPMELRESHIPVYEPEEAAWLNPDRVSELRDNALNNHPEIRKISIKIKQLEIDRKLATEFLKPEINLSYYFLNKPFDYSGLNNDRWGDNYKFGVDFSMPVFLRKERSKLALTKLKIANSTYQRSDAQRSIRVEIDQAYNRLVTLRQIITSQQLMVDSYNRIVNAELLNLAEGESDLFKINVQLEKLLQSQSKLLKQLAELEKEKVYFLWASGVTNLDI